MMMLQPAYEFVEGEREGEGGTAIANPVGWQPLPQVGFVALSVDSPTASVKASSESMPLPSTSRYTNEATQT